MKFRFRQGFALLSLLGVMNLLIGGCGQSTSPQGGKPEKKPTQIGETARKLGATSIAVPAFAIDDVPERVSWARQVLA